ncbi:MAG: NAD-dependent epimerase/dehydratase family protein [Armatimonadetes bacterium]|nr:NAD-dependent epimerase/dehydratase family protein [Armatimonadota bacterium]NIO75128.1 NAD-dependent epimerase/dehydratase family protein [Armatimonadota bacterium]NIO95752.1 NAD-dependent epimerase/dehydratase family protein [Armatimonadota bacterium]
MRVAVLGGAGRVGSNAAYALQIAGDVSEILLTDVAKEQAEGEALDLRHGASLSSAQKISHGDMREAAGCDVIIHCAGLRRKPDESRLDLINRNLGLFRSLLEELSSAGWNKDAILLVVANPVDILTHLATELCPLPKERIIGLGTLVDTARFRSFIGEYFSLNQTRIEALILGEHGDSMVPMWSSAAVNGVPLTSLSGFTAKAAEEIFRNTQTSGADVIRLKGGAGYCVGLAISRLLQAIVRDQYSLLPISTLQRGTLGIEGVCLSLPTIVARRGVADVIEPAANEKERAALMNSADTLKKTLSSLQT